MVKIGFPHLFFLGALEMCALIYGLDPMNFREANVCPNSTVSYKLFDKICLAYISDQLPWTVARDYCWNLNPKAELVKLINQEENNNAASIVRHNAWIGLNDRQTEGRFRWIDGDEPTYTNWNENEPNNCCTGEDSVEIKTHGRWNDQPCQQKMPFVCEIKAEKTDIGWFPGKPTATSPSTYTDCADAAAKSNTVSYDNISQQLKPSDINEYEEVDAGQYERLQRKGSEKYLPPFYSPLYLGAAGSPHRVVTIENNATGGGSKYINI